MSEKYCYLITVGVAGKSPEFTRLLERFAPRYELEGVHVCFHSTLLPTDELSEHVGQCVPDGTPFFVGRCSDYRFQPTGVIPEESESSDPG